VERKPNKLGHQSPWDNKKIGLSRKPLDRFVEILFINQERVDTQSAIDQPFYQRLAFRNKLATQSSQIGGS
jgi:hypothetical protein